jgi:hypothetical protein
MKRLDDRLDDRRLTIPSEDVDPVTLFNELLLTRGVGMAISQVHELHEGIFCQYKSNAVMPGSAHALVQRILSVVDEEPRANSRYIH